MARLTPDEWAEKAEQVAQLLYLRAPEHQLRPRLEPTRRTVELLGDPQRNYRVIHLTGTNGKTTTARIIERILREYGLRTGRFTSPHLVKFNERIAIDGEPVADEVLVSAYENNAPLLELIDSQLENEGQTKLTFFEAMTALAFQIFSDAPIEVLVLEVGMGGEWDSTNVADGELALFTPISLDHQKSLGDTVAEIASTKAGIIKPGSTVISAAQQEEAMSVLRQRSRENEFMVAGDHFELISSREDELGTRFSVRGRFASYQDLWMPVLGSHQAENAALAIAAVESFLGRGLDDGLLRSALSDTVSPGRLQIISREPLEVIDGAHNLGGAQALIRALPEYFAQPPRVVIVGILDDKDVSAILDEFAKIFTHLITVAPESPRAISAVELAELAAGKFASVFAADSLFEALVKGREVAKELETGLVVTGSLYLVGNLLRDLQQGLEHEVDE